MATRMIYSDSQSPSLNDSRPGATSCWREVLSCVVVSARSQRLLSRRLSLSSSCCRNCGICDGGGAISPPAGVSTRRDEYGRLCECRRFYVEYTYLPTLRSRRISSEITLTQSDYFMGIDSSRS